MQDQYLTTGEYPLRCRRGVDDRTAIRPITMALSFMSAELKTNPSTQTFTVHRLFLSLRTLVYGCFVLGYEGMARYLRTRNDDGMKTCFD